MQDSKITQVSLALEALEKLGYVVHVKSDSHLEVQAVGKVVDYWPTTGKWRERGSPFTGQGYDSLLDVLGRHSMPEDKDAIIATLRQRVTDLELEIARMKPSMKVVEVEAPVTVKSALPWE
jgi:hypothetical protein